MPTGTPPGTSKPSQEGAGADQRPSFLQPAFNPGPKDNSSVPAPLEAVSAGTSAEVSPAGTRPASNASVGFKMRKKSNAEPLAPVDGQPVGQPARKLRQAQDAAKEEDEVAEALANARQVAPEAISVIERQQGELLGRIAEMQKQLQSLQQRNDEMRSALGGGLDLEAALAEIHQWCPEPELADEVARVSQQIQATQELGFPVLLMSSPAHQSLLLLATVYTERLSAATKMRKMKEIIHVALHCRSTIDELLGSFQIGEDRSISFTPGSLIQACSQGKCLILEGLDYAPASVLEVLESVAVQLFDLGGDSQSGGVRAIRVPGAAGAAQSLQKAGGLSSAKGGAVWVDEGGQLCYKCSEDFRLVGLSTGHKELSTSLLSHFVGINFQPQAVKDAADAKREAALELPEIKEGEQTTDGGCGEDGVVPLQVHAELRATCGACVAAGRPGLLVGEPGCGKASAWRVWAARRGGGAGGCIVVRLHAATSSEDLLGSVAPCEAAEGKPPFCWHDGPVARAIREGCAVLLCGLHLPAAAALNCLAPLLRTPRAQEVFVDNSSVAVHPDFCLFASTTEGTKQSIDQALLSYFTEIGVPGAMDFEDYQRLAKGLLYGESAKQLQRALAGAAADGESRSEEPVGRTARAMQRTHALLEFSTASRKQAPSEEAAVACYAFSKQLEGDGSGKPLPLPDASDVLQLLPALDLKVQGRADLMQMLSALHAAQVPVILEGPPGCGKTLTATAFAAAVPARIAEGLVSGQRPDPIVLSMSSSMEPEELFGRYRPQAGCRFVYEPGPLERALREGRILIVDEINLGSPAVLQRISDALVVPVEVTNPLTGEQIQVHPNFWLVGTQNPQSLSGRSALPQALRMRVALLKVEGYTEKQERDILAKSRHLSEGLSDEMKKAILDQLWASAGKAARQHGTQFDIRAYVKLCRRVCGEASRRPSQAASSARRATLERMEKAEDAERIVRLHVAAFSALPPKAACSVELLPAEGGERQWRFTLEEAPDWKPAVEILLPACGGCEALEAEVTELGDAQRKLLVQMACAVRFQEPLLLVGPSSFKAHTAGLLARMLRFENTTDSALNTPLLSKMTDLEALLGGVEPHSAETFAAYCLRAVAPLLGGGAARGAAGGGPREEAVAALGKLAESEGGTSKELVKELHDQLVKCKAGDQIFPVCERGIVPNIRYGGMCLLVHVEEVEAAVLEGLNSLFEVEQTHFMHPQLSLLNKLEVHSQFYTAATAAELQGISPAVLSRFTCLQVPAPSPDDLSRAFSSSLRRAVSCCGGQGEERLQALLQNSISEASTVRQAVWLGSLAGAVASTGEADEEDLEAKAALARWLLGSGAGLSGKIEWPDWASAECCRGKKKEELWAGGLAQNAVSQQMVWQVVAAAECQKKGLAHPAPLFIGPPGVGKTFVCRELCKFLGMEFVRVQCSMSCNLDDFFGGFTSVIGEAGKPVFTFKEGIITKAARDDHVLVLLDELNLLGADTMSAVTSLLRGGKTFRIKDIEVELRHCLFCCTMNPENLEEGRAAVPEVTRSLLSTLNVDLGEHGLRTILKQQWDKTALSVDTALACRPALGVNLRGMRRLKRLLPDTRDPDAVVSALRLLLPVEGESRAAACKGLHDVLRLHSEGPLAEAFAGKLPPLGHVDVLRAAWARPDNLTLDQYPGFLLITGPPCCGKRTLVRGAACDTGGRKLIEVSVSSETREADLFGEVVPVSEDGACVFKFVEGPVCRAAREGLWLLIANVDRIKPEVLERLNSLGECPPSLFLVELGKVPVHPAFRLFCTSLETPGSKPKLSAAFRDRCVTFHLGAATEEWCAAAQSLAGSGEESVLKGVLKEHKMYVQTLGLLPHELPSSTGTEAAEGRPTLRGLRRTVQACSRARAHGAAPPPRAMLLRVGYGNLAPRPGVAEAAARAAERLAAEEFVIAAMQGKKPEVLEEAISRAAKAGVGDAELKDARKKLEELKEAEKKKQEEEAAKKQGKSEQEEKKQEEDEKKKKKKEQDKGADKKDDAAEKGKKTAAAAEAAQETKKQEEEAWYTKVEKFDSEPWRQGLSIRQLKAMVAEHCGEKGEKLQKLCDDFNKENADSIKAGKTFGLDPNLYAVNMFIAKVLTKEKQCSVAQLFNPDGLEADFFLSHAWAHPIADTVRCLSEFVVAHHKSNDARRTSKTPDDYAFWICLFANNQHHLERVIPPGGGLEESSFVRMLKSRPQGLVMVLDERALPLTRVWCICELLYARQLNLQVDLWTRASVKDTEETLLNIDVSKAQASVEADKAMIERAVMEFDDGEFGSGFDGLNHFVKQEAWDMVLRFYNRSGNREGARIARKHGANPNAESGIMRKSMMIPMAVQRVEQRQRQMDAAAGSLCRSLLLPAARPACGAVRVILDNSFLGIGLHHNGAPCVYDLVFSVMHALSALRVRFEVLISGDAKRCSPQILKAFHEPFTSIWRDLARAAIGPGPEGGGRKGAAPGTAEAASAVLHLGAATGGSPPSLPSKLASAFLDAGVRRLGWCTVRPEPGEALGCFTARITAGRDVTVKRVKGADPLSACLLEVLATSEALAVADEEEGAASCISREDPFLRDGNRAALDAVTRFDPTGTWSSAILVGESREASAGPYAALDVRRRFSEVSEEIACEEAVHLPGHAEKTENLWQGLKQAFQEHTSKTAAAMLKAVPPPRASGSGGAGGSGRKLCVRKLIKWFATNGATADLWEPRSSPSAAESHKVGGSLALVLDLSGGGRGQDLAALAASAVFACEQTGCSLTVLRWDQAGLQLVKPAPTRERTEGHLRPSKWDGASRSALLRALADGQQPPLAGRPPLGRLSDALLAAAAVLTAGDYPQPRRVLLVPSAFDPSDHAALRGAWAHCEAAAGARCTAVPLCPVPGALPRCVGLEPQAPASAVARAVAAAWAGDAEFAAPHADQPTSWLVVQDGEQTSILEERQAPVEYLSCSLDYDAGTDKKLFREKICELLQDAGEEHQMDDMGSEPDEDPEAWREKKAGFFEAKLDRLALGRCFKSWAGGKGKKAKEQKQDVDKDSDEDSDEEQTCVVIHNGSTVMQVGFSGDDAPRSVFPTVVGTPKAGVSKDAVIGDEAQAKRGILKLQYPIEGGVIQDWDCMEKIWHHAFYNELRVTPEECKVILSEPPLNPKDNRERTMQIMFEVFSVTHFHISSNTCLATYASGRTTALVVDMGQGACVVAPVYEGYTLPHAVMRMEIGGSTVDDQMTRTMVEEGHIFQTTAEREMVRNIKETLAYVAQDFEQELKGELGELYEMPDGTEITVTGARLRGPEVFFQPGLIGMEVLGIHEQIYNCIMKSDEDIRKQLYGNILLVGGSSMFTGMAERIKKEVTNLAPESMTVKVIAPPERKLMSWVGASILASLSSMDDQWVKIADYEEEGPSLVHRKCTS